MLKVNEALQSVGTKEKIKWIKHQTVIFISLPFVGFILYRPYENTQAHHIHLFQKTKKKKKEKKWRKDWKDLTVQEKRLQRQTTDTSTGLSAHKLRCTTGESDRSLKINWNEGQLSLWIQSAFNYLSIFIIFVPFDALFQPLFYHISLAITP